ncbi:hypothetical protein LINGRAHAP2_LOCUS35021, partial [Linum grandiflorum]
LNLTSATIILRFLILFFHPCSITTCHSYRQRWQIRRRIFTQIRRLPLFLFDIDRDVPSLSRSAASLPKGEEGKNACGGVSGRKGGAEEEERMLAKCTG